MLRPNRQEPRIHLLIEAFYYQDALFTIYKRLNEDDDSDHGSDDARDLIDPLPEDVRNLIFSFSRSPPVDLKQLAGGSFISIRQGDSFELQSITAGTQVRATWYAPMKDGRYYYELHVHLKNNLSIALKSANITAVGWCDSAWDKSEERKRIGDDKHSWAYRGWPLTVLHDEVARWKKAVENRNQHTRYSHLQYGRQASPAPPLPADFDPHSDELDDLGPIGTLEDAWSKPRHGTPYPVCRHRDHDGWKQGDVIGCGIELSEGKFDVIFYRNGEHLGEAWYDCTYAGEGLYPACEIDDQSEHLMVFGRDDLKYLPEGFEPLYSWP